MKLIDNPEQLEQNLETVEFYLTEGTDFENDTTIGLVRAGACFVAYEIDNELRFAPSRFVGYKNNNLDQHLNSHKDGRDTNAVIERMMDDKLGPNEKLEKAFLKYCRNLGIEPYNKQENIGNLTCQENLKQMRNWTENFLKGKYLNENINFVNGIQKLCNSPNKIL